MVDKICPRNCRGKAYIDIHVGFRVLMNFGLQDIPIVKNSACALTLTIIKVLVTTDHLAPARIPQTHV